MARALKQTLLIATIALLTGCTILPPQQILDQNKPATVLDYSKSNEVVMVTLGLMETDYRFGGSNPESGLDCSGMVSYIYENAVNLKLPHNAAEIARLGREIDLSALRPGDLVFFNTQNRSYSHVGIYIGGDRFVHAPSTNGKVQIDSLKSSYYAKRLEAARTFFN